MKAYQIFEGKEDSELKPTSKIKTNYKSILTEFNDCVLFESYRQDSVSNTIDKVKFENGLVILIKEVSVDQ